MNPAPKTLINAVAPIRICDIGGWTDTWFAVYGSIFNIAVSPNAEVQIAVYDANQVENRIVIHAENFGDTYAMDPAKHSSKLGWNRHPLLEAAIEYMQIPDDIAIEVTIFSEAPAGASTGTSAAVTAALIGGLDYLTPGQMTPYEIAASAQKVETVLLKQQCGIQDQLASAFGGISYIEMSQYPQAAVSAVQVPNELWWELERRLVLIYLGKSHASSEVHEMVIRALEDAGPECSQLTDLRSTAPQARDALVAGDFRSLGKVMIENTEFQRKLHAKLISDDAQKVMDIAREFGAWGWKVNGAGGEGGSLTILSGPRSDEKRAMIQAIAGENILYKPVPISLNRYGLQVWEQ